LLSFGIPKLSIFPPGYLFAGLGREMEILFSGWQRLLEWKRSRSRTQRVSSQLHSPKIALYDRMLKEKDEMMAKLETLLEIK